MSIEVALPMYQETKRTFCMTVEVRASDSKGACNCITLFMSTSRYLCVLNHPLDGPVPFAR